MKKELQAIEKNSPRLSNPPQDDLNIMLPDIERVAGETLPKTILRAVRAISHLMLHSGVSFSEACTLVGVDEKKFITIQKDYPIIDRVFKVKELQYKKNLMNPVIEKAKTDPKLALELLELRFPEEFSKKKRAQGDGVNIIENAIQFIQQTSSNDIVNEASGRADRYNKERKNVKITDVLA